MPPSVSYIDMTASPRIDLRWVPDRFVPSVPLEALMLVGNILGSQAVLVGILHAGGGWWSLVGAVLAVMVMTAAGLRVSTRLAMARRRAQADHMASKEFSAATRDAETRLAAIALEMARRVDAPPAAPFRLRAFLAHPAPGWRDLFLPTRLMALRNAPPDIRLDTDYGHVPAELSARSVPVLSRLMGTPHPGFGPCEAVLDMVIMLVPASLSAHDRLRLAADLASSDSAGDPA